MGGIEFKDESANVGTKRTTVGNSSILSLDRIPHFEKGIDPWAENLMPHISRDKWDGILVRCRTTPEDIDQQMMQDLMREVVYQVKVRLKEKREGRGSTPPAVQQEEQEPVSAAPAEVVTKTTVVYDVPAAVLSMALMRALIGQEFDGRDAVELMEMVEKVVGDVKQLLKEGQ